MSELDHGLPRSPDPDSEAQKRLDAAVEAHADFEVEEARFQDERKKLRRQVNDEMRAAEAVVMEEENAAKRPRSETQVIEA
jgi:hypothetical protein